MHVTYFQHLASHRHDDFFQPVVPSLCRAQNSMYVSQSESLNHIAKKLCVFIGLSINVHVAEPRVLQAADGERQKWNVTGKICAARAQVLTRTRTVDKTP